MTPVNCDLLVRDVVLVLVYVVICSCVISVIAPLIESFIVAPIIN